MIHRPRVQDARGLQRLGYNGFWLIHSCCVSPVAIILGGDHFKLDDPVDRQAIPARPLVPVSVRCRVIRSQPPPRLSKKGLPLQSKGTRNLFQATPHRASPSYTYSCLAGSPSGLSLSADSIRSLGWAHAYTSLFLLFIRTFFSFAELVQRPRPRRFPWTLDTWSLSRRFYSYCFLVSMRSFGSRAFPQLPLAYGSPTSLQTSKL
jgi:hypothetical protein